MLVTWTTQRLVVVEADSVMTKYLVLHFCNDTFQYCVPGGVLGESIERAQKGKVA